MPLSLRPIILTLPPFRTKQPVDIVAFLAGLAARLVAMPRRNSTIGEVTTMRGIFGSTPIVNSLVVTGNTNGFRVLALNVLRNQTNLRLGMTLVVVAINGLTIKSLANLVDVFLQALVRKKRCKACYRATKLSHIHNITTKATGLTRTSRCVLKSGDIWLFVWNKRRNAIRAYIIIIVRTAAMCKAQITLACIPITASTKQTLARWPFVGSGRTSKSGCASANQILNSIHICCRITQIIASASLSRRRRSNSQTPR